MPLSTVLFNCIIFNNIKKYLLHHNMLGCLADTCTSLRQYKFEDIMILTNNASYLYYTHEPFRQTILNYRRKIKTKYPQFKFGLHLPYLDLTYSTNKTLHDIFEGLYYVDLSYTKELTDITPLKDIPIVRLIGCSKLTNIEILSHIGHKKDLSEQMINTKYLNLDWYYNTKDRNNINSFINLADCIAITDFSSLQYIMHVDLAGCDQITSADLIHFSYTKTLNLSGCNLITDVSMLSHLEGLNISRCYNITDVSHLSQLHTLKLHRCRITDVSALGNVKNLDLSSCCNLTNVSALGNVEILVLSCCNNLTDVSALGNVKNLDLHGCDSLMDVSGLSNVRELNLNNCEHITDVSNLINVEKLYLLGCYSITDIPCFTAKILDLSFCKITDFSKLINVQELILQYCTQITNNDLQFFVNKRFLDLTGCTNITNVDILLDNVQVLNLSLCKGIKDLSPFADDGITTLNRYYTRTLK